MRSHGLILISVLMSLFAGTAVAAAAPAPACSLSATPAASPLSGAPGERLGVTLRLRNTGREKAQVAVRMAIPRGLVATNAPGWARRARKGRVVAGAVRPIAAGRQRRAGIARVAVRRGTPAGTRMIRARITYRCGDVVRRTGIRIPVTVTGPTPAGSDLTIALQEGPTHRPKPRHLRCDPAGGDLADPAAACARLAALADPFGPAEPPDVGCITLFSGPETLHISGTWRGAPVTVSYSRTNGCQEARFQELVQALGLKTPAEES